MDEQIAKDLKESFRQEFDRELWIVTEIPGQTVFVFAEATGDVVSVLQKRADRWLAHRKPVLGPSTIISVQTLVWHSRWATVLHASHTRDVASNRLRHAAWGAVIAACVLCAAVFAASAG